MYRVGRHMIFLLSSRHLFTPGSVKFPRYYWQLLTRAFMRKIRVWSNVKKKHVSPCLFLSIFTTFCRSWRHTWGKLDILLRKIVTFWQQSSSMNLFVLHALTLFLLAYSNKALQVKFYKIQNICFSIWKTFF